jgi:hypothetical protein
MLPDRPDSKIALASSVDIWLAAGMTVAAVGTALVIATGPPYRPEDAFGLVLAAAGGLVLLWRQTLPLVAITGAAGRHRPAAAFCTFVRVPRAVVVRSDMTVRLLGTLCYRLFAAAAVRRATLWACGYLPRLVSFFNMPASTATGRCCSPA